MKHKYQSDLFRRFVASGLAAVFIADTFSSYVGAINELKPKIMPQWQQYVPVLPMSSAKVNIGNKVYRFNNIPSDQISSDFNKYIKDDLENAQNNEEKKKKIVDNTVYILAKLDDFYIEEVSTKYTILDFFEYNSVRDENEESHSVKYSTLYKEGYFNNFINDFPKLVDVVYFSAKGYLNINNDIDIDNEFFLYFEGEIRGTLFVNFIEKHFKDLHSKIKGAAKRYFEDKKKLNK